MPGAPASSFLREIEGKPQGAVMRCAIRLLSLSALLLAAASALAQPGVQAPTETKETRQGRALAVRVCSICHGIRLGQASVAAGAPNFYTVAMTPGMTALALRVALQRPHHSMPDLALTNDELRNVTAYILSLRPRSQQ